MKFTKIALKAIGLTFASGYGVVMTIVGMQTIRTCARVIIHELE